MKTIDTSVYVVDDDASVREAVESLIRSAGFSVRTFASAHEFLASPRAEVPSCLVLDVHLPGLNGLDLQRELARADIQIPIIFLTAHGAIPTSVRASGPFVALSCAALPEALLESELFGYEKGAFTGAVVARPGRLEQAAGGTLFLDEVGEMSPAVQAKFLRVLQEREFQRLGGTRMQKANVRVIAATNRDLRAALAAGAFREDLFYRLHVFAIRLPPLRERPEDIAPLLEHFVTELGPAVLGRPAAGITREAQEQLLAYSWPGNVRELRNAVERALILSDGRPVTPEHLSMPAEAPPPVTEGPAVVPQGFPSQGFDLEAAERELVERALRQTGQNKAKAARLLGLTRTKLYTRMQRFGLS